MNDEIKHLQIAFPLDSDGFLRRECPTCLREFKWRPTEEPLAAVNRTSALTGDTSHEATVSEGEEATYFCPYCRERASVSSWLTRGQQRKVERVVTDEVIGPALRGLEESLERLNSASGGFLSAQLKRSEPRPGSLTEEDDMVRVDFPCHPEEPIKIEEDWEGLVVCLICGTERRREEA